MTLVETLPIIAAGIAALTAILILRGNGHLKNGLWQVPALFCALFAAWSLYAVIQEGPTGFWPEHTRNLWGNQIWFDLLIAITIGWFFIVPKAKALGMRLPLWLIFIFCTGSIGLTAMLARFLYLQDRQITA